MRKSRKVWVQLDFVLIIKLSFLNFFLKVKSFLNYCQHADTETLEPKLSTDRVLKLPCRLRACSVASRWNQSREGEYLLSIVE
jgi:hypothetical protein